MAGRGCFVTGTDTGAGKTIVAAAIVAALRARGERVGAFKPVVTGLDEPDATWPADHELLATTAGMAAGDVTSATFGPAASPHLAAEIAERRLDLPTLVAAARAAAARADVLVVEGVGGLLVPFGDFDVRDLAVALGLPRDHRRTHGAGDDQPRAADDRGGARGRARRALCRAHSLAGGAEPRRALQPRDDRAARRRPGRHAGSS